MNPTHVLARCFRSYDELDVDLPTGCVAILGDNGSGKSSLVSAIDIGLFGARSLSHFHSDTAVDDLLIEVQFDHADATYRVRRTYSSKGRGKASVDFETLTEDGWQPLTAASAAATQDLIESTIGLSRATFYASSFLAQGRGGRDFTEAYPRERKKVLAEVLGLSTWDGLRDRARADVRDLERQLAEIHGRVAAARATAATRDDVEREQTGSAEQEISLADDIADLERERAQVAECWQAAREQVARRQAAEAELQAARQRHAHLDVLTTAADDATAAKTVTTDELATLAIDHSLAELIGRETMLAALEDSFRAALAEQQTAFAAARTATVQRNDLVGRTSECNEKAATLRMEASMLDARPLDDGARCDHCGQILGLKARAERLAKYESDARELDDQAKRLDEQAAAIVIPDVPAKPNPPQADGDTVANHLVVVRHAIEKSRAQLAQRARLEERLVALRQTIAARPATDDLLEADRAVLAHERMLATFDPVDAAAIETEGRTVAQKLKDAQALHAAAVRERIRLDERLRQIAAAENSLVEADLERKQLDDSLVVLVALERAFSPNGIPALIVENSAIPYLEAEASRILADLGTSFRVELRTQAELKSGDGVRDTLDVIVCSEAGERPYETFSGGERTRINLALRIALARLLAHRRGADSRLLCIDEPEFLDEQGTSALVDVLRGLQDDFDRLYIVSHVPGLRDSFETTLTVTKSDGVSRVMEAGVFEEAAA